MICQGTSRDTCWKASCNMGYWVSESPVQSARITGACKKGLTPVDKGGTLKVIHHRSSKVDRKRCFPSVQPCGLPNCPAKPERNWK
jgi:hypothetical protein